MLQDLNNGSPNASRLFMSSQLAPAAPHSTPQQAALCEKANYSNSELAALCFHSLPADICCCCFDCGRRAKQ